MQVGLLIDPNLSGINKFVYEGVRILARHFPNASLWTAVISSPVKFVTPSSITTLTSTELYFAEYSSKLARVLGKQEEEQQQQEVALWKDTEQKLLSTWQSKELHCTYRFIRVCERGDFYSRESMYQYFTSAWALQTIQLDNANFLTNQNELVFSGRVELLEKLPVLHVVEKIYPITWISKPTILKIGDKFIADHRFLYVLDAEPTQNVCTEEFKRLILNSIKEKKPLERCLLPGHLQECSYRSILAHSTEPFVRELCNAIQQNNEFLKPLLDTFQSLFSTYSIELFNGDPEAYLDLWEELSLLGCIDYEPFSILQPLNPHMSPSYLKLQRHQNYQADCIALKRKCAYSTIYSLSHSVQ